jgi:hypothetical protein
MSPLVILGAVIALLGVILTFAVGGSSFLIIVAGVLVALLATTRARHKAKYGAPGRLR